MNGRDGVLAGLTLLFLAGAVWRVAGEPEGPRVIWPTIPTAEATPARRGPDRAASRVALAGNVFSATRRAPAARFRPGAEAEGTAAPTTEAVAYVPPPPPPPPQYRVAGTMLGNSGGMALIDADASSPQPEVYRQGDAVGAYRLETVAYDHVVLVGAAGELRLPVAKPGDAPRAAPAFTGPVPNAGPDPNAAQRPRATSSANTPPGAIPPGW